MTINVLIVEDHTVVSQGLEAMLADVDDLNLLGTRTSGEEAISASEADDVAVMLMDVSLSGSMNGIEATKRIKETKPETKILVLTMYTDPATVAEAIKAGADGYMSKGASREALLQGIRDVAQGRSVLDPTVTEGVFGRLGGRDSRALSDREVSVLQGLSNGLSTKEVASEMHLSEETIKTYLKQVFRKLQVRDRTEAVAEAFRRGLIH
ncbi:MAG: response regulator transcription factor [Actinomycetota bacterium]|nr:response regulator transcription factor [Actinomycetota bacterium]